MSGRTSSLIIHQKAHQKVQVYVGVSPGKRSLMPLHFNCRLNDLINFSSCVVVVILQLREWKRSSCLFNIDSTWKHEGGKVVRCHFKAQNVEKSPQGISENGAYGTGMSWGHSDLRPTIATIKSVHSWVPVEVCAKSVFLRNSLKAFLRYLVHNDSKT